jgi:hypothetical protein
VIDAAFLISFRISSPECSQASLDAIILASLTLHRKFKLTDIPVGWTQMSLPLARRMFKCAKIRSHTCLWQIVISSTISQDSPSCYDSEMRNLTSGNTPSVQLSNAHPFFSSNRTIGLLSLPKMPSGPNFFAISHIQEDETEATPVRRLECIIVTMG